MISIFLLICLYLKKRNINVNIDDFKIALGKVGPSMQRGYQINIEKKGWQDIGGLEEVKKVINKMIIKKIIRKKKKVKKRKKKKSDKYEFIYFIEIKTSN